jgi:hypothetical protein
MAVSQLPIPVQQSIGGTVLRLLCEAWLDYIYMHRVKFRYAYCLDKQAEGKKALLQEVKVPNYKMSHLHSGNKKKSYNLFS